MVMSTFHETGAYQAARADVLCLPYGYKKDGSKRGVIICHGAGELAVSPLNYPAGNKQAEALLIQAIASVYPTIIHDAGTFGSGGLLDSDSWGSVNAQAETDLAINRLIAPAGGGAINGPVIIMGFSMGHVLALNYAQASAANRARLRAIGGVLPVNDSDDIRDNNRGGFRASVGAPWGANPWISAGVPPLPAGANPALPANQTRWLDLTQRLWFAPDDAICTVATVNAMVANVPIITTVNLGNGGHTDASFGHVNIPDMLTWLASVA